MKRWHTPFAVLVVCLLTFGSIGNLVMQHSGKAAHADGTFTIIDLGNYFEPVGISDNGTVAGQLLDNSSNVLHPVTWLSGAFTDLSSPSGVYASSALAISPTGEVVGGDQLTSSNFSTTHALKWESSGSPTDLGGSAAGGSCDLSNSGNDATAYTVNDIGDIAGSCQVALPRAGYWPGGTPNSFTQLPDVSGGIGDNGVTGINHKDDMVGFTNVQDSNTGVRWHAVFWKNGTAIDISPSGSSSAYANAINDNDLAVGNVNFANSNVSHPYVWNLANNQTYDLSSATVTDGNATAVNKSGIVVGYYSAGHAFMWKIGDNGITDLNDLLPTNSGWELQIAYGINSSGQIVGIGTLNGQSHAFLLNPSTPSSYQLTLAPASQTATIGGGQGLVTATLLDGATSAPASNVKLSFRVEAGQNAGMSGTCLPSSCTTDANGQVDWGYLGKSIGVDTVQVWMDTNGNGVPDSGEPQTTATVTWTAKSVISNSWAGYVLTNTPLRPVSAVITVPTVPSTCATTTYSAFWVGFNGVAKTKFLPQVGFNADCLAGGRADPCTGATTGSSYYIWWQINPQKSQNKTNWICSPRIGPGDKVYLKVVPAASQVTLTASVINPDGSFGPKWSYTFKHLQTSYSTMECIAEDPLTDNGHGGVIPFPFAHFGSVEFDNCSAILDYRAGVTLLQYNMYKFGTYGSPLARTGPFTPNGSLVSFTVTRVYG